MSDIRDPETDQQLPERTNEPFVQDLVVADIEERKKLGIRKYGTGLQASNGRDHLQDAYEEALDMAIYLRAEKERRQLDEGHVLQKMTEAVVAVNQANGWHDQERTFGEDIALLHSEVSEALEAYRSWGMDDATLPECVKPGALTHADSAGHLCKPEGVGSELADVMIRLLDTSYRHGVDLVAEYKRKLAFNATRGHRHGGKLL